jgi:ectoine hydroxylase-related dioxygenase (phytanoyl-CoA dioxygenase family)
MSMTKPAPAITVSDAEVRQFVDQGFLVRRDLVQPAEVEALRRDIPAIARGEYPAKGLETLDRSQGDEALLRQILCIHQPHHISPVMRQAACHPAIAAVLSQIVGAHLPHWDGRVKCMQTMLFVKPPGKPGQAWHQDERYIPTRDRSLCGAWIALDDATIGNGCLWVIPGSHRMGQIYQTRPHGEPEEYDASDQAFGFDTDAAIPVEVPVGAVVFFNGYLLHKSLRNRSQIYRRALVSHYMNAWSLLPWRKTADGTSIGTLDVRCVIPVAGEDPYPWQPHSELGDGVYLRRYHAAAGG